MPQRKPKILSDIARFFKLGNVSDVRFAGGEKNRNFFVRTNTGEYFIKIIFAPYTRLHTEHTYRYILHLAQHGFPAAPFLTTKNGAFIFEDNEMHAIAQKAIHGSHLPITMATTSCVGKALGTMSQIPQKRLPKRYGWFDDAYAEDEALQLRKNFSHDKMAREILNALDEQSSFAENILPRLPKSIIHTDLHGENILFHKGKLIAIVDWDDATVGPSLFDFASSAIYWCFGENTIRPKIYQAFYDGYTEERALTELEKEHLVDCIRYVAILQTMWRFLNYGQQEKGEATLWALRLVQQAFPKNIH